MNPTTPNLRSHHSLRNSVKMQDSAPNHLNPVATRMGLTKKTSLNLREDHPNNSSHKFRLQLNNEVRNSAIFSNPVSQPHIHHSNRIQYPSREQTTDIYRKIQELSTKVDIMGISVDSHESRLKMVEFMRNMNTERAASLSREQAAKMINRQLEQRSIQQAKSLQLITSEIERLKFELNNLYSRPEFQKKVENCVLSIKGNWLKAISEIENRTTQDMEKTVNKFRDDYAEILDKIEEKWENVGNGWSHLQQEIGLALEELNIHQKRDAKGRGMISKLQPLFDKPNLRLKFLAVASLIGTHDDNPEQQTQLESQLMVYKMDSEGYLLDEQNRYILNSQEKPIKLSQSQIRALQEYKIFK